jgi:hypothetical protein
MSSHNMSNVSMASSNWSWYVRTACFHTIVYKIKPFIKMMNFGYTFYDTCKACERTVHIAYALWIKKQHLQLGTSYVVLVGNSHGTQTHFTFIT